MQCNATLAPPACRKVYMSGLNGAASGAGAAATAAELAVPLATAAGCSAGRGGRITMYSSASMNDIHLRGRLSHGHYTCVNGGYEGHGPPVGLRPAGALWMACNRAGRVEKTAGVCVLRHTPLGGWVGECAARSSCNVRWSTPCLHACPMREWPAQGMQEMQVQALAGQGTPCLHAGRQACASRAVPHVWRPLAIRRHISYAKP